MALDQCAAFDTDGDQGVAVDELLQGIGAALHGCSPAGPPGAERRSL
jgi:hypothetical protein